MKIELKHMLHSKLIFGNCRKINTHKKSCYVQQDKNYFIVLNKITSNPYYLIILVTTFAKTVHNQYLVCNFKQPQIRIVKNTLKQKIIP